MNSVCDFTQPLSLSLSLSLCLSAVPEIQAAAEVGAFPVTLHPHCPLSCTPETHKKLTSHQN